MVCHTKTIETQRTQAEMVLRLIGYARISTVSQIGNTSIDNQKEEITKYCQEFGFELVHIFEEQGSGENFAARPTWMMIQENVLATPDIDGVVCFHQSRVSRNTGELCTFADALIKAGKHIKIVGDPNLNIYNSNDYFKFTIVSAMDRKDRIDSIQKLQDGRALKAAKGGYAYGSPAFGKQSVNRELGDDENEQKTIDVIRRHRKSGKSFAKIADYLNAKGYPTKQGKQWHASSVSNVYKRLMVKAS